MFNDQYGVLSVDNLPNSYGYGDDEGGELQGATLMSQGAVAPKGLLHDDPDEDLGGLKDVLQGVVQQIKTKKSQRVEDGDYVWDYYEGDKIVLVSGPSGTPGVTEYAAGTQAYNVVAEKAASGSTSVSGREPDPERAAAVGAGIGSFFTQVTPTIIGLFGPTQDPQPTVDTSYLTDPPIPSTNPLYIAGGVVVVGALGYAFYRLAIRG
jgi:hypothetical protein